MSPSWHNRLLVGLAPHQVDVLRYRRGLKPHLAEAHALPVEAEGRDLWQRPLETLAQFLDTLGQAKHDIHVVLSNHFVHYAVIPEGRALSLAAERQALVALVFEQRYGALARDWELRLSPSQRGHPALASGIPHALIDTLKDVCSARGPRVRLNSLRPLLMSAFNRVRREITATSTCLAVVETGRITLARYEHRQWHAVTSRAVAEDDVGALDQLLAEDAALSASTSAGTLWLEDLTDQARLKTGSAWSSQTVPHFAQAGIAEPCLALRGLD